MWFSSRSNSPRAVHDATNSFGRASIGDGAFAAFRVRALIVGAGAVGQVYAHHLPCGGAKVSVFVREKYADPWRDDLPLIHLNQWRGGRRGQERSPTQAGTPDHVLTSPEEVRARDAVAPFEQIWLCVSSSALADDWLPELLAAVDDAAMVLQQPGLEDHALIAEHIPDERIVQGFITMINQASPLPGARAPSGTAYDFAPFVKTPFSGTRGSDVVRALGAGGSRDEPQPGRDSRRESTS